LFLTSFLFFSKDARREMIEIRFKNNCAIWCHLVKKRSQLLNLKTQNFDPTNLKTIGFIKQKPLFSMKPFVLLSKTIIFYAKQEF